MLITRSLSNTCSWGEAGPTPQANVSASSHGGRKSRERKMWLFSNSRSSQRITSARTKGTSPIESICNVQRLSHLLHRNLQQCYCMLPAMQSTTSFKIAFHFHSPLTPSPFHHRRVRDILTHSNFFIIIDQTQTRQGDLPKDKVSRSSTVKMITKLERSTMAVAQATREGRTRERRLLRSTLHRTKTDDDLPASRFSPADMTKPTRNI